MGTWRRILSFLFFTALVTWLLRTSILNGFWWDDAFFSVRAGDLKLSRLSWWEASWLDIQAWLKAGRAFPVAVLQRDLFHHLGGGEREPTRLLQFGLVYLNALQVLWFLRRVTRSFCFPLLAAFLFVPLVQYRVSPGYNYVEPVSGLGAMLQVCFFFCMASIHSAYAGLRAKTPWATQGLLALSALCALSSLLTYEIGAVAFLVVAWMLVSELGFSSFRKLLRHGLWHSGAGIAYLLLLWSLKRTQSETYDGVQLGELRYFWIGFRAQLIGTLPLSYALLLDVPKLLQPWPAVVSSAAFLTGFSGIAGFLACMAAGMKREACRIEGRERRLLVAIAAAFMLLPCVLMGISKAYQLNQVHGMAYLPVYFSYFGMALALGLVMRGARPALAGIVLLAVSFIGGFHSYYNQRVFDHIEDSVAYTRDAVFEAIKAGLLEGLDEEAFVLSRLEPRLEDSFGGHDKLRALAAVAIDHPPHFFRATGPGRPDALPSADSRRRIYLLQGKVDPRVGGWLALSRLEPAPPSKDGESGADFCAGEATLLRLMDLVPRHRDRRRIFTLEGTGGRVVLDSGRKGPQPIVGSPLRRLFNQDRLISELRAWEAIDGAFRMCEIRVEER